MTPGRFALETHAAEIGQLIPEFLGNANRAGDVSCASSWPQESTIPRTEFQFL